MWTDGDGAVPCVRDATGGPVRRMRRILAVLVACGLGSGLAAAPPARAEIRLKARLVQRINLAKLRPSSSDSAGVTWLPETGRLLFVDCNIDELPSYKGVNMWEITRSGSVEETGTTRRYSSEPTGVAYDTVRDILYVSDDDKMAIFVVRRGGDGRFGTSDDDVDSFSVGRFGVGDPEDVAVDPASGDLFVVDGVGKEVFRLVAAPDGTFGGLATHFDMGRYGAGDPEGIAYDPIRESLFVLDSRSKKVYELDTGGTLHAVIDVSEAKGGQLAGVTIAPASEGDGMSLWVVDRGINNTMNLDPLTGDPPPNDGKLHELAVDIAFGQPSGRAPVTPAPVGSLPPVLGGADLQAPSEPGAGGGYRLAAADGGVFTFGDAVFGGSAGGLRLAQPIVATASTPTRRGYWMAAADGGIFPYGDAAFHGSTGNLRLARPIVGMAGTASGHGYWLVASDGGIFAFGDAAFRGSTGALRLAKPIVGMHATPSGQGYWLVASDGGIFAFGDAAFHGSTGAIALAKPIVGMHATPSGQGYWLVASDGGIFAFGDAAFHGSTGALKLAKPIVGMAATDDGTGYWLAASDGGIFAFGRASFLGSAGALRLTSPVVGLAR